MWQKWWGAGGCAWTAAHIFWQLQCKRRELFWFQNWSWRQRGLGVFCLLEAIPSTWVGREDSIFPSHAYAYESCFCNHLSFQLSWDLGKDLNASWVKRVKGANHCQSCFWLRFAEGSANTEPLTVNTLNTCGSSCLDELCKNTSKDIGNPKQVSSDIKCKLHQPVLGDSSQERLASDWCTPTQRAPAPPTVAAAPHLGAGDVLRARQNREVLWIKMLHTSSWEVQELNTAL